MSEIAVCSLRKEFKRMMPRDAARVVAVDGIDLRIEKGEIYGFLGPNGAGKTTTIKMILGLIRPTSGTIEIRGGIRTHDGRYRLGAVMEGNRNIYYRMTVAENLWYFGLLRGIKPAGIKGRTTELLEFLDIADKRDSTAQTLSRGMQQKLAVACALVHNPDILLLDEPTLGLDVSTARAIQAKLLELSHKQGKAVLLTTHQMDLAQAVSDKVGIINKGKIVAEDTVERLTGLFRRLSYVFDVPIMYAQSVKLALSKFEHSVIDDRKLGKLTVTVHIADVRDIFALMRALEANGIVPENLTECVPNLEDVFVSFTTAKSSVESVVTGGDTNGSHYLSRQPNTSRIRTPLLVGHPLSCRLPDGRGKPLLAFHRRVLWRSGQFRNITRWT